ncbi:putative U-box domain-containing protein 46 [Andrographis paniculata]|uniref:putative U-box domain-containing protein 46 n=1 Tax=Andrographis paniculata TaxID=175694 RepID=UPI0021E844AA|nr:putative U-box domain-containing protein 46 [Andrographis paniculata]
MASRVHETILECINEAQSSVSIEDKKQALQTLVTVTKVSPQNRNLVAQTDAAVATLLDLSKSPDSLPQIQTLSLSVLFNLSLNPNLKLSLARLDTILLLNDLVLLSSSDEPRRLAASLLCSLAMLDKNKAKFGVAGTVQVLLKAISGPRSTAAHHLLSSLAELVQFHGNCTVAVRAGAVPVLIAVAESTNGEDLSGTALSILGLLARFEEGLNELREAESVVARLVGILKRGCMLSKEGACEILLRLFEESQDCLREAVELPEFSTVLADVSVRGSGRVREKAAMLMKKIMDADLF